MKSPGGIARWLGDHFAQCGGDEPSVNRARTFSYESEIPAATNINASLLANVIGVEHHLCLRQIKQYVSRAGPGREHCCRQRQPE